MEFKIGDIITTYHKGYWRLDKIEDRYFTDSDNSYSNSPKDGSLYQPIFYYSQVMTTDFIPKNGKVKKLCDVAWCRKIDKEKIKDMKKKYIDGCDYLLKLLDSK